jgi:hypothetical protein
MSLGNVRYKSKCLGYEFDGRLHYSLPTLACILVYSASVILSNIAHGWTDKSVRGKVLQLPLAASRVHCGEV